jgi:hypothetical protein
MGTTTITVPRVKISFAATLTSGDSSGMTNAFPNVGTQSIGIIPPVGVAAGDISNVYNIAGVVTSGTPVTYDVTSLTDQLGNAINLARVQGVFGMNLSTTTGQIITITGGTSNPLFTDSYTIQPNLSGAGSGVIGSWNPSPGFAVDGTHKTIKVTVATGTNVPFEIAIVGCSA